VDASITFALGSSHFLGIRAEVGVSCYPKLVRETDLEKGSACGRWVAVKPYTEVDLPRAGRQSHRVQLDEEEK
jgi:hypothetical protein